MESFPDETDLMWLFEADAQVLDPALPWAYNRIRFVTERGADTVEFEMEPGYRIVRVRWEQGGVERTQAQLNRVQKVEVRKAPGGEALVETTHAEVEMVVWLKPEVRFAWSAEGM